MVKPYKVARDGRGRITYEYSNDSVNSPRGKDGKLKLRSNPHFFRILRANFQDHPDAFCSGFESGFIPNVTGESYADLTQAYNSAYGSFMKNVHYQDSSLGVTLLSGKQSVKMIGSRLKQLSTLYKSVKTRKNAQKLQREIGTYMKNGTANNTANTHLEYIFGWVPLYEDIKNALGVLITAQPSGFLTGRGRDFFDTITTTTTGNVTRVTHREMLVRCSISANVEVDNPNKWMLNRLGLLNPAPALWDIIPWSFVVGMFVNVNTILKSYSDTMGLNVKDVSVTYTSLGTLVQTATYRNWEYPELVFVGNGKCNFKVRSRVLYGTIPRPRWQYKVPDLSLETLQMAASLLVQQVTRIGKLLR